MIIDALTQAGRYQSLHPLFGQAIEFLRREDLPTLDDGKHTIIDDRLFVLIARGQGRGREQSPLEFHRRYIDIQYVVAGNEEIGLRSTPTCQRVASPYDEVKEFGLYHDAPTTWFALSAGQLAIFFPEDAHAPLAGHGPIHKAVVKVAVE